MGGKKKKMKQRLRTEGRKEDKGGLTYEEKQCEGRKERKK